MVILRRFFGLLAVVAMGLLLSGCGGMKFGDNRGNVPLKAATISALQAMGSSPGEAMLIRIYKQESALEVWKRTTSGTFRLFKTYEICAWSGELGPKLKEGDRQAPEGFYTITAAQMNPNSIAYLSFNTGFPNKFDRAYGRTGSDLMVHGDCSSRGCYALTNDDIAEVYALARESFKGGNASFQLQAFPFRMTAQNLAKHVTSPHMPFWKNLKDGADRFDLAKLPPSWDVCEKKYVFDVKSEAPLEAAGSCPPGAGTLTAALSAKQEADAAALAKEIAAAAERKAREAAAAKREADAEAAAKARGEAIGSFIGGLFGGQPQPPVTKVIDPTLKAPIPKPRIDRG